MKKQQDIYDAMNRMAAILILAEYATWGGAWGDEDSLAVRWARMVLKGEDDGQPSV